MRPLIDAHLDLAWMAMNFNRDLLASVADVRRAEEGMTDEPARGRNTVTLPELRRARVPVCVATLMARSGPSNPIPSGCKRTDLDYVTQAICLFACPGTPGILPAAGEAGASEAHHQPRAAGGSLRRLDRRARHGARWA